MTLSTKSAALIEQLRRVATREIEHINRGSCPDKVEGFSVRDDECPACKVLIEADRILGHTCTAQADEEQIAGLTPEQQAHVDSAFLGPQGRVEMASYFLRGVEVVIFKQSESGASPPFAVVPKEAQDFWLGCWDTPELAAAGAAALGLRVAPLN